MSSSVQFAHLKVRTSSRVFGNSIELSGSGVFAHAESLHVTFLQTLQVLQPGLVQVGLAQSMQRTPWSFLWWMTLFEKQSRGFTSPHTMHCKPRQFRQRHSSKSCLLLGYLTPGPGFKPLNTQSPDFFWQSTSRQTLQVVHSGTVHGGFVQAWHTNGRLSGSCRQCLTRRLSKRAGLSSPQASHSVFIASQLHHM